MNIKVFSKIFLALFLLLPQALFAQNTAGRAADFPRLEPDLKALEFFLRGQGSGGFSWMDFAEISLWASGANPEPYLAQIRAAAEAIQRSPDFPAARREQAEYILTFMHANLLRSYLLTQSRIDTIFTNGRFNCVSSAVLYMILAKSAGFNVSGVITRDHAFVMVHIDGEAIDVETTNRLGFDPGNRREFHDEFGRITGFAYVPAQNYRDRETISPIELVSLIMSNEIYELERRTRFSESIPIAIDRSALLTGIGDNPNTRAQAPASFFENPRRDIMNRLFNYGAFLLSSNREEDCLRWAAFASQSFPDERWEELSFAAVNNRIARFVRANNLPGARNFLAAEGTVLSEANYTRLDTMLLDSELLNSANRIRNTADGDSVLADIEAARANGRISDQRATTFINLAVQRATTAFSSSRDWLAAIDYVEHAIARFGSNSELERSLQNFRNNRAIYFHNRFATEWNRRNFDSARQILNEGLTEFPNDRQLLANLDTINRQM